VIDSPARCEFFVIACVGRQGSSYLQGLIDNHPNAQCLGELFAPEGTYDQSGQSCNGFLDAITHARHPTVSVSGFKLGYMHMELRPEIRDVLREKNYYCIHLTRKNMLDQYISMRLAQINGIWASSAGIYQQHSFIADTEHMIKFFGLFEEHDCGVVRFIEGLPTIEVVYEQLVASNGYFPVLDFLGLPRISLASPFARQRSGSQRDAIQNYDEVAAFFKSTDRAQYFVE
jgi:LPS sulfotransferase NodH